MDLQQLRDKGGFVEAEPVRQMVTWTRVKGGVEVADTFDVWVRLRSFGMLDRVLAGDGDRSRSAEMIAQCLLLGEAREAMTYEDAFRLDPGLAFVLVNAIREATAPKA